MANVIPEKYRAALVFNPLIPIIAGYQDVLLYNRAPAWPGLVRTALVAALLLLLALTLFRKAGADMVDQL
jgi:lipopolysaccharide transport system permease protein